MEIANSNLETYIFNKDSMVGGMPVNQCIVAGTQIGGSKTGEERFNDLVVPIGLFLDTVNVEFPSHIKQVYDKVIPEELFDALFDNVLKKKPKNHESSSENNNNDESSSENNHHESSSENNNNDESSSENNHHELSSENNNNHESSKTKSLSPKNHKSSKTKSSSPKNKTKRHQY